MSGPVPETSAPRPLLIAADAELLDALLQLSAAAGIAVDVADGAVTARRSWSTAPLIVVEAGLAASLVAAGLGRRDCVVVVGRDQSDSAMWRQAVELGAELVVFLPDSEEWLIARLTDSLEDVGRDASAAQVLAVIGGRGGAGASTLAAALAFAGMRSGRPTVLVDGDPLGGGLDLLLGGEDEVGLRWPDLAATFGRLGGATLRASLPKVEALTVLSWDRGSRLVVPPEAMRSVLAAATRGGGLVVVDLPRRLDAAAEIVLGQALRTFLIVPAEIRATAAAARVAASISIHTRDLTVVVRGPSPASLEPEVVAASLGLKLAGSCRAEPGLAAALERGEAPGLRRGPLFRLADQLIAELPVPHVKPPPPVLRSPPESEA